ncbi:MAG: segregation and condensation protein A [Acidimicrobiia bacterium]
MPYEVRTPVFEGDLELLTQMVSRSELDIFEICLAALVTGYLAEVAGAPGADLEQSTEFLVLASTLVELKTRFLLAGDDDDGGDVELGAPADRDLLLARMLQGVTFKGAAGALAALIGLADRCVPRRAGPEEPLASVDIDPLESVSPDALRAALLRALAPRPVVDLYHVTPIRATVSDAIDRVVGALSHCQQLSFDDLMDDEPDRIEVIVRFLAVLELYKQGLVEIEQLENFGALVVRSRAPEEGGEEIAFLDDYDDEPDLRDVGEEPGAWGVPNEVDQ